MKITRRTKAEREMEKTGEKKSEIEKWVCRG